MLLFCQRKTEINGSSSGRGYHGGYHGEGGLGRGFASCLYSTFGGGVNRANRADYVYIINCDGAAMNTTSVIDYIFADHCYRCYN